MTDPWHGHTFQHFCNKFNFFAKLNADGIMVSLSCHWRPYTLKRLILHDALFESLFPYDLPLCKWLRHHQQLLLVMSQPWIFLSLCYPMRICIHSFPQMGWKFFSAESTPLVIQWSPVTWQVIVYVFTLYFICLFISLFLLFFFISIIFPNQSLGTFFHRYRIPIQFPWFHFWISYCGFGVCSQSCCEVLFFVAVEGMLIYFLWSMPDIKPYIDWKNKL